MIIDYIGLTHDSAIYIYYYVRISIFTAGNMDKIE